MQENLVRDDIRLTDIFEIDVLQSIQDAFSGMTKLATGFSDENGKPVTKHSVKHDFCAKYTKGSPVGRERCQMCDERCAQVVARSHELYITKCHNGLVDFVAPIVVEGRFLGIFHGGQVLTEPLSEEEVRQKAEEFGIDPDEYAEAAKQIPLMTREEIERQAEYIYKIANIMSRMEYSRYNLTLTSSEIAREAHMKSDFLANMSHEIRTPMNAVLGMAEMALREELPPAAREYVNQIRSASNSLLTIINDILDFSKIESGKMNINMAEYEPLSVVYDVANILMTRIGNKNVELVVDFEPEMPYQLMGDSVRIKQVLMNIANNAVKFTKEGCVKLSFSHERISDHEALLMVAVSDTGIGIKEGDIGKLFQSFSQLDSKRNRNIEGTGLGLAISKQLVSLMSGMIHVKSEYGKGSTFSFEIPQLIVKDTPSVVMKSDHGIMAGVFTDNPYLHESFEKMFRQLKVDYRMILMVEQLEEFAAAGAEYLFIDQPMFGKPVHRFVEAHPDITCVLMTGFRSNPVYSYPNLSVMKKPMFTLNLAAVLNREELYRDYDPERREEFDFIAPEAEILIVDDNQVNLTVAEGLIKPIQARVDTALSGKDAIERIAVKHYDLIFMDHMMPELDGVETTHIIRRFHEEYSDVPIIALTANVMEETRSMFLAEGMNDFVAKPTEGKVLMSKLRQWLPKEKIYHVSEEERNALREKMEDEEDDSLLAQLRGTGMFNVAAALAMLGNEKLYWTVLKDYYRVIDKKAALLRVFYEARDWKNYAIEVHSLKSASRQIGAEKLGDLAADMEKAANEKNFGFIVENQNRLIHLYETYKFLLAPFMEEKPAQSAPAISINKDDLLSLFELMNSSIANLDMDGMEIAVQKLAGYSYPEEQKNMLVKLTEAVEELDVDTCTKLVADWKALL